MTPSTVVSSTPSPKKQSTMAFTANEGLVMHLVYLLKFDTTLYHFKNIQVQMLLDWMGGAPTASVKTRSQAIELDTAAVIVDASQRLRTIGDRKRPRASTKGNKKTMSKRNIEMKRRSFNLRSSKRWRSQVQRLMCLKEWQKFGTTFTQMPDAIRRRRK